MDPAREEEVFRGDLLQAFFDRDMKAFKQTRLVFADWLLDQNRSAEAALTRADWVLSVAKRNGARPHSSWLVPRCNHCDWTLPWHFAGYYSTRWYLCFPPGRLRAISSSVMGTLTFRWSNYPGTPVVKLSPRWKDTGHHPEGFAALFMPATFRYVVGGDYGLRPETTKDDPSAKRYQVNADGQLVEVE